jgi:hypothetical protein
MEGDGGGPGRPHDRGGHGEHLTRFISGMNAALLLISGAYVTYYWLSASRLLLA